MSVISCVWADFHISPKKYYKNTKINIIELPENRIFQSLLLPEELKPACKSEQKILRASTVGSESVCSSCDAIKITPSGSVEQEKKAKNVLYIVVRNARHPYPLGNQRFRDIDQKIPFKDQKKGISCQGVVQ